MILETS